jgi:ADP-ribose pyrophosphatase
VKKVVPWKLLAESESRGPSGFMRIITRKYKLPDGRITEWDLAHAGGQTVAILALTPDNKVVLVKQYRPGPDLILDEMPGGHIDDGETPLEAAKRELLEESGYVGDTEIVASTWLSAAAIAKRYVAVARNCRKVSEPKPTGDEFCEPIIKDVNAFLAQVRKGELTDTDLAYLALDHAGLLPPAKK